ncbi:MAG: phage tail length tape measure family protein [Caulobacterales bacterium]|nr:phage tail length tape measure family protein [Caulobacterales bacterium]
MKRDVELVIKARDEASRAANTIAETLDKLARAANQAGTQSAGSASKLDVMGAAIGRLQGDYRAIAGAVDGATAAYTRQRNALAETQAQQASLVRQTEAARAALARLKSETAGASAEKTGGDLGGARLLSNAADIKRVEQALAGLERQQNQVTTSVVRQEAALNDAGLAMQRLGSSATAAEIAVVEAAIQKSAAATRDLTSATAAQAAEYARMAREARAAGAAEDAQRSFNSTLRVDAMPRKSAAMSGAVFEEQLRLQEKMAASAARIRAQLDPLTVAQDRYNDEVAQANALHRAGMLSADELARHLKHLEAQSIATGKALRVGGRGDSSKVGIFGLKPYEIQNLTYQVNDLFTQLASGTSVTQALAQQGGQIVQIFGGAGGGRFFGSLAASAGTAIPLIAGVGIALFTVGDALKRVGDLASSERGFGGLLAATADGGLYNARDLAQTARDIDMLGGSLKDARKEVDALVKAGVSEAFLEPVAIGAQRMAKALGIDVVEAARLAGTAFTGNFEAVKELDKATNVYTKTQLDHIEALFKEGKASEARTYAFNVWSAKMEEGAGKMEGRWAKAMRTFGGVWDLLMQKIGDSSAIQGILKWIDDLISRLDKGLAKLAKLRGGNALVRAETRQTDLQAELASTREANTPEGRARRERQERATAGAAMGASGPSLGSLVRAPAPLRTEAQIRADMTANDARIKKLRGESTDPQAQGEGKAKEDADAAAKKAEEDRKKAEAASRRAESKAESDARALESKQDSIRSALESSLAQIESQAGKAQTESLDARLEAVDKAYNKIKQSLEEARTNGVTTVDGMTLADYEARVEAAKDLLKQQVEMKFRSEQIAALEEQRATRLKDITDRVADGSMTALEAVKAAQEVDIDLAPQMEAAAKAALAFAYSLRTATLNPALEAYIARMERVMRREATPGGANSEAAGTKAGAVSRTEQDINALLQQRNDIVRSANELLEQGRISWEERERRIADAYASTTPQIEALTQSLVTSLIEMRQLGELPGAAFDAWMAKIEATRAGLVDLHNQVLSVGDANEMLVDASVGAWDKFVNAVQGGQNAFAALFDAVRSSVVELLTDLSKLIIKALLMRAIMKSPLGKMLSGLIKGAFDADGAKEAARELMAAGAVLNLAAANLAAAAAALGAAGAASGVHAGASSAGGSTASNAGSFFARVAASFFGGGTFHTGGVVAGGRPGRMLPAQVWANARRFHNGGLPGLRPNEVATILEKGEEVVTSDNPRHVGNGGGRRGDVKVVNVFNPADVLEQALGTTAGERVLVNYVRQNKAAFKAALA